MKPEMASSVTIVSKCTIFPASKSTVGNLKLTVSDLPMLSCNYIQKGLLFTHPQVPILDFVSLLKRGLSKTLTHFPALAGRLTTDPSGHIHVSCNDAGVDFVHANATNLTTHDVISPVDVPDSVKEFFALNGSVSYDGHFLPIMAVKVTELSDGVFVGCAVNHAVTDGTSFWNFFNSWTEVCRGVKRISRSPDFTRIFVKDSPAVLKFPAGGSTETFSGAEPLRERIFHFSGDAILEMKSRANIPIKNCSPATAGEIMGKMTNDEWEIQRGGYEKLNCKITDVIGNWLRNAILKPVEERALNQTAEISSFQSLSAQLWRSVTRARNLPPAAGTTFRMAVNCRRRVDPPLDPHYFGNAIQSIPTVASAGELLTRDLRWCAGLLNRSVTAHGDATVRRGVDDWEKEPKCFPLGNSDGASITMGSSPRFPMYGNDFGWGPPVAVRSGRANKFDGKISAFPGREGGGSVDLEVCLAPVTMAALETDTEFMQYVSG